MDRLAGNITEGAAAMTTFHTWDDVKHEIFDEADIAAIDEYAARTVTGILDLIALRAVRKT
jgi:hypothetical protein